MAKEKASRELHASFRPCRDYIIAMLPLMAMAIYLYGLRPLIMFALAVATAMVCDLLACVLRGIKYDISDISGIMFALMYTLMLPASSRYGIVVIGVAFTVLFGKHAFGGYGRYPFHPSAFGFTFASVCWADELYLYPKSFSEIGTGFDSGAALFPGVASSLKYGGVPETNIVDLFVGNYPGPMGTTFCLIILSCMVLFFVHKTVDWRVSISFLITCTAATALFPQLGVGRLSSVMYEMFAGALIFCAVFIVPEPSLTPVHPVAKVIYGVIVGTGTVVYSRVGAFEMGVCFSVMLLSPMALILERWFAGSKMRGGKRNVLR